MKRFATVVGSLLLVAGCDQKSAKTHSSSEASAKSAQTEKPAGDGQLEAEQYVETIKGRINSALPSYYTVGKALIKIEDAVGNSRRGMMMMPVIASEDLYRPTGEQMGERQIIDLARKQNAAETLRFRLLGTRTQDTWHWADQVEDDVQLPRDVKPLSAFPQAVVKNSPDHLALIKQDADRKQREADEAAALDAKARAEKLPPLKELLQPGRKAIGVVDDAYFNLVVSDADSSGTMWTLDGNTMSKDGTKHFTDRGKVLIGYEPKSHNVVVKEVTLGALRGIRGASISVVDGKLSFTGARWATTQPFEFK